jgi:transposase
MVIRDLAVDWTNNVSEHGAKAAKRHQAVSGYWHSLATIARWCRVKSYLDSAAAHDVSSLNAVRAAIERKPWLLPLPSAARRQFTKPHEWTLVMSHSG